MKNKILFLIVVLLTIIYYYGSFAEKTSFFSHEVIIKDTNTNKTLKLEMENYLIGVLAAEMPASFEYETLKAQAVASRTYAYYKVFTSKTPYHLTTDSTTQNYITKEQMQEKWQDEYEYYLNRITKAVNDTRNEVLYYDDKIISAYYFAMSNGYTEDASLVFGETKNYLKSVVSKEDISNKNYKVIKKLSKKEFCALLGIDCFSIEISNVKRSSTGRVNNITINNKTFKGTEVRKLLKIRSTDFTIELANEVSITTYGYGHGVGMSQYGANSLAKEGYDYKKILAHYYDGTILNKINV